MSKSKSLADNDFIMEMKDKNGDSWYHQIVLETKDKEIQRLKEEYVMLQNASDEVEEEKDKEIERLKDLCNKYEEEHKTTFEEWKKAINIINELEKWLDKKEKLTFNSWNKGIHEVQRKLQELKGGNEPSFEEMVGFVENVCKDIKSQSTLHEELEEERKTIAKIVGDLKEVIKSEIF